MKKIIILIIINLFSFNSVGYAAIDCANPEKMSEKFKCKLSSFKKDNKDNDGKEKKFGFKNPFKKLNEWNKNNKTLADVIK
mgnify:CR=1 FL=1|tara:strand:- start:353 stop:595 length:243 start_codon:yes stop_codon:yes gene_type:complete